MFFTKRKSRRQIQNLRKLSRKNVDLGKFVKDFYVEKGLAYISCNVSGYNDIIDRYSVKGYEWVEESFARFVEKGQKYYMPRTIMPIDQAVEIIVNSGGVPVLAHPFQYKKNDEELRELIEHCMDHGLKGMECRYSGYGPEKVAYLEALAAEYGLVKTGGSDFHGDNKPHIQLGTGIENELDVPYAWLEKLKKAAGK